MGLCWGDEAAYKYSLIHTMHPVKKILGLHGFPGGAKPARAAIHVSDVLRFFEYCKADWERYEKMFRTNCKGCADKPQVLRRSTPARAPAAMSQEYDDRRTGLQEVGLLKGIKQGDDPVMSIWVNKIYEAKKGLTPSDPETAANFDDKQLEAWKDLVCDGYNFKAESHFWLAHLDVNAILNEPNPPHERGEVLNEWHSNMEILRNMPKATIAVLAGRVGGGGHEFALSLDDLLGQTFLHVGGNFDMRFGLYDKTKICQMEVPLGIIPGGGACVNLRRLLGAGRAMEVILSGDDIEAEQAERWGLLNRCFKDREQLEAHVARLAQRLAQWPSEAVRCAKASVLAAERMPHTEDGVIGPGAAEEGVIGPEARARLQRFLKEGGQSWSGEMDLQSTLSKLLGQADHVSAVFCAAEVANRGAAERICQPRAPGSCPAFKYCPPQEEPFVPVDNATVEAPVEPEPLEPPMERRPALKLKQEGNDLVRSKKFQEAVKCYEAAIAALDIEGGEKVLLSSLHANLALCYLNLELYRRAQDAATQSLDLDPWNTKALYRRCLAHKALKMFPEVGCLSLKHVLQKGYFFARYRVTAALSACSCLFLSPDKGARESPHAGSMSAWLQRPNYGKLEPGMVVTPGLMVCVVCGTSLLGAETVFGALMVKNAC
eukprot:g27927.t1